MRGSCAAAEKGYLTHQVLPLGAEVGLVGQAALHHVQAVVVAGPHAGHAPAVRAVHQLHDGTGALVAEGHLWGQKSQAQTAQGVWVNSPPPRGEGACCDLGGSTTPGYMKQEKPFPPSLPLFSPSLPLFPPSLPFLPPSLSLLPPHCPSFPLTTSPSPLLLPVGTGPLGQVPVPQAAFEPRLLGKTSL